MNTKKLLALVLGVIMIFATIPVVVLSTGAAEDNTNLWTTNREADEKEAELYRPAAGYTYTGDGFVASGADFEGTNPFLNVETNRPVNVKDGLYMEVRIDDFSYRGYSNADEWISFNIWTTTDRALTKSPSKGYGEGYLNLLRSAGNGGAASTENYYLNDEKGFTIQKPGPFVTPTVDEDGKEIWTFQIIWNEDFGYYTFIVNGSTISEDNNPDMNLALQEMSEDGMFYAGITLHSGQKDGTAALTVLKYGNTPEDARIPTGTDSKVAEMNPYNTDWVLADPSSVAENTPAMLWDATNSSFTAPVGTNLSFSANTEDNSYHVTASDSTLFTLTWAMKKDIAYDGKDFPIFVMLVKNLWCNNGNVYFCAGDVVSPTTDLLSVWGQYDNNAKWYTDADGNEYTLVVCDMSDRLDGRVHSLRVDFDNLDTSSPEYMEFDIMYMGMFRTMDEAINYTNARYTNLSEESLDETEPDETESESESESASESVSESASESASESVSESASESATEAAGGCGSVVGMGAAALLLSAIAAAVVLKKRD